MSFEKAPAVTESVEMPLPVTDSDNTPDSSDVRSRPMLPDPFDPRALALLDPFDPAALAIPPESIRSTNTPKVPPRHKQGEKFLKGPIPWIWIATAARLPGKALAVAMAIWFEAGCRNSRTISITLARLARLGMNKQTASRAIQALERSKLITVKREDGRALRVELKEVHSTAE